MEQEPLPIRAAVSGHSECFDSLQQYTPPPNHHNNLPYFLTVLQHLDVDILPITWQPALDSLGRGKFTFVNQSLVNVRTSFAFKRSGAKFLYEDLLKEISILKIPRIRDHPNVNTLVGVCWEISVDPRLALPDVRPVLVFPKAHGGSLKTFMAGKEGAKLELHEILCICLEVCQAMEVLHSCNVIHGDIKPDNVLVFDTVSGGIHVKLIDFGYSSLYTGPNDTNRVPATRPWNAPEWHTRGFSSDAARKMDVYSYGLLCLWLLLHSSLAFQPGSKIRDLLFPQRPGWMLQDVERFKKDSTLLDVLGREICCSDPWLQSQLQNIFKATLKKDPRNRDATLETCRRTFESIVHGPVGTGSTATQVQNPAESEPIMSVENANTDQNAPSINKSPQSLPTHIDLDLTDRRILLQLSTSDFEVRAAVKRQLLSDSMATTPKACPTCAERASLQIAMLESFGLGPASEQYASVKQSFDQQELKQVTEKLKAASRQNKPLRSSTVYNEHNFSGSIHLKDSSFRLSYPPEVAREVERESHAEFKTAETRLGDTNLVVLSLKRAYALLLKDCGRYAEALELFQEVLDADVAQLGEYHHDSLTLMDDSVHVLSLLGKHNDAAMIAERSFSLHIKHFGEAHLTTQMAAVSLAQCRILQGSFKEADGILESALRSTEPVLGKDHPYVCNVLGDVAFNYREMGEWDRAANLQRDVITRTLGSSGESHPKTLTARSNLASTLSHQGLHGKAQEMQEDLVAQYKATLGKDHFETIVARYDLAVTYRYQDRLEDAERALHSCIKAASGQTNGQHPRILRMTSTLATVKFDKGSWREALEMEEEAYEQMKVVNGEAHPDTLMAASNLANTLSELGEYDKAEELEKRTLESKRTALGPAHPDTLLTKGNLAVLYRRQSRFAKAEALQREVASDRERLLGPSHPDTLTAQSNVATVLYENGRAEEALDSMERVLETRKRVLGPTHSSVVGDMGNIAALYCSMGRMEDAEEMEVRVVEIRKASLGPSHPHTLLAMRNLATTYIQQERWSDAGRMFEEVVRIREELLPGDRALTEAKAYLAAVREKASLGDAKC